jgi:hypothetical protein
MKLHELNTVLTTERTVLIVAIKNHMHRNGVSWHVLRDYLAEVYEVRLLNELSTAALKNTLAWLQDRPTMREESTIWIMRQLRKQCKPHLKRRR